MIDLLMWPAEQPISNDNIGSHEDLIAWVEAGVGQALDELWLKFPKMPKTPFTERLVLATCYRKMREMGV